MKVEVAVLGSPSLIVSHLNVSLIVTGKVIRQCPQNTFFEEKK